MKIIIIYTFVVRPSGSTISHVAGKKIQTVTSAVLKLQ